MAKRDPDTAGPKFRKWQRERNEGRAGWTKHRLDGLRGLRVLSFCLTAGSSRRGSAACAVWGAGISTSELETEIRGYTVQSFGDLMMGVDHRIVLPLDELKASVAATAGDVALLWLMPAEDSEAAKACDLIDCGYREYVSRVEEFSQHVTAAGGHPIIVECPLRIMRDEISRLPENDRTVTSALVRLVGQNGLTFGEQAAISPSTA